MSSSSNLESTAEALEALMKIRSGSTSSVQGMHSHGSHDAGSASSSKASIRHSKSTDSINSGGNGSASINTMSGQMQQSVSMAAMRRREYTIPNHAIAGGSSAMGGLNNTRQHAHSFNFPLSAAAAVSMNQLPTNPNLNSQMSQFRSASIDWETIGMQPSRSHSTLQSFTAAYLSSNAPSAILPKIRANSEPIDTSSAKPKAGQMEVRTDEVERALRSKPQRGKKRNNLNNDERKELTRSRNRLHAKTTRQRKKARYDELVECEKKYLQLMEEQKQSESRKKSVVKFIAFCTRIINTHQPPGPNPNDSHSAHSSPGVSTWGSAFGHAPSAEASLTNEELDTLDLFARSPLFSFTSTFGMSRQHLDLQGLQDSIHDFARDLREMFSDAGENRFEYIIPGNDDGIAMSCDSAFSTFHIVQKNQNSPVSCGLIRIKFVEHSHRISLATLHTTSIENVENGLKNDDDDVEEASASPPLGGREYPTFPSVVSLEKDSDNKKKSEQ